LNAETQAISGRRKLRKNQMAGVVDRHVKTENGAIDAS
jgi:hypothetical protein